MHIHQQQQQQHQSVNVSTPSFQHQPPTSIPSTPQTGILHLFLHMNLNATAHCFNIFYFPPISSP